MNIYIFLLVLSIFILSLSFLREKNIKIGYTKKTISKKHYVLDLILLIILILVSAYRNKSVGTDLNNYLYMMSRLNTISINEYVSFYNIEFLFAIFQKALVFIFSNNYEFFFKLFTSILFLVPTYFFVNKFSKNTAFSFFLLLTFSFYNQSFNIIRQFVALGLLFWSLKFLKEGKEKEYLLFLIILFFIHKTTIIGILFFLIYKLFIKKNKSINILCYSLIAIGLLLFLLGTPIISWFVGLFHYNKYLSREIQGELGVGFAINILLFLILSIFSKQISKKSEFFNLWYFLSAITIVLNIFAVRFDLISRLIIYGRFAYLISIPDLISSFEKKGTRYVLSILVVVLFTIYYLYILLSGTCYDTIPYILST